MTPTERSAKIEEAARALVECFSEEDAWPEVDAFRAALDAVDPPRDDQHQEVPMTVRAKFVVTSVKHYAYAYGVREIEASAVMGGPGEIPENQRFHKATPSGSLKMIVDNPPAAEVFVPGMEFYVDFTPGPKT